MRYFQPKQTLIQCNTLEKIIRFLRIFGPKNICLVYVYEIHIFIHATSIYINIYLTIYLNMSATGIHVYLSEIFSQGHSHNIPMTGMSMLKRIHVKHINTCDRHIMRNLVICLKY